MATLKFKRSAVPNKVPTTFDLALAELGMNTFDGKLYLRGEDSSGPFVREIGSGGGGGGGTWGSITGLLSDQTDLQSALDNKQPLSAVLTATTASFTTDEETKLAGIEAGATANDTDAELRDRATHTGSQAISTVTGLTAALEKNRYNVPFGFTTAPTASEVLLIHVFAQAVTFAGNWASSRGTVGANPASSFVLTVAKNGSSVGTITVSTAGAVTFSSTSGAAVSFAAGDVMRITGPASPVAGIENAAFTLLGDFD